MSRIPDDIESKYNKDNKFKWVDSQLEKFMNRQREDAEYIENLEGGVSEMEKKILKLTMDNAEMRDRLIELGDDPNQMSLFPL